jgi:hypothetical protein
MCNNCDKILSSRQSKWTHEKNCKIVKIDKDIKDIKDIKAEFKELKKSNKKLEESNKRLEGMLSKLIETQLTTKQPTQIINNNSNNTTNNTVNNTFMIENLRSFGNENYSYVDETMINELYHTRWWLYDFIRRVHFNDSHPENWNIYISNLDDDKVNVYNGIVYELLDRPSTLMRLAKDKRSYLEVYLKELQEKLENNKTGEDLDKEINSKLIKVENMLDELKQFDGGDDHEPYTEKILGESEKLAYNDREKIIQLKEDLENTIITER